MSLELNQEAQRCLQCKVARCHNACPISTEVPAMIRLFKENRIEEAGQMLYLNNPFSLVCSYVCNHQAQCVGNCILGIKSTPIAVNEIEKSIGLDMLDHLETVYNQPLVTEKKVAIIGAGPSGIAAALLLRSKGIASVIYEKQPKLGGTLRYGIPDFRLSHSIIDRYETVLEQCGIVSHTNTCIDQQRFNELRETYSALLVAVGVWEQKDLHIEGEKEYAVSGVDYLVNPEAYAVEGRVIVLGAGNSAIDVSRVAKRSGAAQVDVYARTNRIRASQHELDEAASDGVILNTGMAPQQICADGVWFEKKVYDENNEWDQSIPAETCFVEARHVIVSINRGMDFHMQGIELDKWQNIAVDAQGMSSLEGVYASGDAVTGARTVVHAVAQVKPIVEAIQARVMNQG